MMKVGRVLQVLHLFLCQETVNVLVSERWLEARLSHFCQTKIGSVKRAS